MAPAEKEKPTVTVGARSTASASTAEEVPKKVPAVKDDQVAEATPDSPVSGPLVGDTQSILALGHDPASKNVIAKPRNPGLPWQEPPTQEQVDKATKVAKDADVTDLDKPEKEKTFPL